MKHASRILSCFSIFLLIFSSIPTGAQNRRLTRPGDDQSGQKRLALVIGNGAYRKASRLDNPVNDANDIAVALEAVGFEVIKGTDQDLLGMRRLIRQFGQKLGMQKGVGLFYYAGHGVEVKGRNFLIPVDADIASEAETEDYGIDVDSVLRQMDAAQNGFNIVVLDACRNNPFARGWSRNGDTGGLANVIAPTGTYIAYSAAPGTTASDGKGTRNSPFATALVKNLKRPNLKLEEVFKATREEVMSATGRKQVPWDSSSLQGDFYFSRSAVPTSKQDASNEPVITAKNETQQEQQAWELVKNSSDPGDLRLFLKEFPSGVNSAKAKIRLEELVWQSAKAADTKDKVKAYLDEFPSGANAAAARIRLRQLEGAATTPTVPVPTNSPATAPGTIRKNSTGIDFVWIPPGEFMMGSENGGADEKPVRKVIIRNGFWMGKLEVTQAQWQAVMGDNPSRFKDCGGTCPVEQVNWDDAKRFIAKLNANGDGFVYSLPTEAEWEYAARARTTGDRYGNLEDVAWYGDNSGNSTHPGGGKKPNAFGLYDMLGNVWEWVEDIYSSDYNGLASDGSANLSVGDSSFRVLRGGSWGYYGLVTRSALRVRKVPAGRGNYIGFRLVARAR